MPSTSTAKLDVNGLPGGKAAGAAVGAGTGSGAGVVVGAVACIATGPFFPLCVMTVVPAGAAIGAATGAVVGAVRTESTEAMATKTKSLTDQLLASSYQDAIAVRLQERFREDLRSTCRSPPSGPQCRGSQTSRPMPSSSRSTWRWA